MRANIRLEAARRWKSGWPAFWPVGAVSDTVDLYENGGLRLASAVNIPEKVCQIVAWVPYGKGMAGLALERGVPIETCNLKEDASGAVKPGAKAVDAKAAVAIPVKTEAGTVRAVVGIAFAEERRFSEADLTAFSAGAATLPSG
jgi:L-methionine (R)-S-oxide reductase